MCAATPNDLRRQCKVYLRRVRVRVRVTLILILTLTLILALALTLSLSLSQTLTLTLTCSPVGVCEVATIDPSAEPLLVGL